MFESPAHVPALIALLKTAYKYAIQCRSGNNAKLSLPGDCLCQPPVGHASPHATLNKDGIAHLNSLLVTGKLR